MPPAATATKRRARTARRSSRAERPANLLVHDLACAVIVLKYGRPYSEWRAAADRVVLSAENK